MFIGSIDKPSRMICENILDKVDRTRKPDVYVGCSGNFTFDRIAAAKGFRVHSNDVSLYSRVIAGIVTGERFPFVCKNEELNAIFSDWGNDAQSDLIKIMFAAKYGQFADRKNDFQSTMLENYISGARTFYDGTRAKFERNRFFDFQISDFFYGDFKKHVAGAGKEAIIFLYAPTYKGGYEKLYAYLNENFEYEKPEYELFDSKEAGSYYAEVLGSREACIYSDVLYPETEKWMKGEVTYSGSKKTVYLYSSVEEDNHSYFFADQPKLYGRTPRIIAPDMTLPSNPDIRVMPCKVALVNHYKHMFMSARVDYSTGGDFALAFLMNGEVFGFASFASGLGTIKDGEYLFLHSDFVVPSAIDRLSKLLLYILRSKEVYKYILRYYIHAYTGLQTSVYTKKPASMKYRGPFKKLERHDQPGKLTYTAEFTKLSIKECFEKWLQRKPIA